jgi:hypothetical protein
MIDVYSSGNTLWTLLFSNSTCFSQLPTIGESDPIRDQGIIDLKTSVLGLERDYREMP